MLHAPVPPIEEQERIGREADRRRASVDLLICRTREQIEKLREYRQTLISAAVTGQIPVREEIPA
jgi:type I restriction enzyme S subunit